MSGPPAWRPNRLEMRSEAIDAARRKMGYIKNNASSLRLVAAERERFDRDTTRQNAMYGALFISLKIDLRHTIRLFVWNRFFLNSTSPRIPKQIYNTQTTQLTFSPCYSPSSLDRNKKK